MQKYINKLKELDELTSDELISNGSKKHAQALIYQFLINATNRINIISTNLAIYTERKIVSALSVALNNDVKINILLDNYKYSNLVTNEFLDTCKNNSNCDIRTYDTMLESHIITRDDKAFRYCDDPGVISIAVASFNAPEVIKNAENTIFGDFFKKQPKLI